MKILNLYFFLILERSTFQYDFPPSTNKPPLASPPNKLQSINKPPPLPQTLKQNDISTRTNEGKE